MAQPLRSAPPQQATQVSSPHHELRSTATGKVKSKKVVSNHAYNRYTGKAAGLMLKSGAIVNPPPKGRHAASAELSTATLRMFTTIRIRLALLSTNSSLRVRNTSARLRVARQASNGFHY